MSIHEESAKTEKNKQTSISIESVKNGFIVYEDSDFNGRSMPHVSVIPDRKVFNTKSQLCKYIKDNF